LISRKEKKKIEDCLGVETEYSEIANLNIVGSCGVATNNGCLLHWDVKEDEMKVVEDLLKVDVDIGTVNFGSPFVKSGLIANSKGCLLGEKTTPPELARIMEALNLS
jgi:translation initiation factor 6